LQSSPQSNPRVLKPDIVDQPIFGEVEVFKANSPVSDEVHPEKTEKLAEVSCNSEKITYEDPLTRMLSLMAKTIKQQQQEINDLKVRVAELDKKPQIQSEALGSIEAEFKDIFF